MEKELWNYEIIDCSIFSDCSTFDSKNHVEMTGIERGRSRSTLYSVITDDRGATEDVYNDAAEAYADALERIVKIVNEKSSRYGVRFQLQVIDEDEDGSEGEDEDKER